MGEVLLLEGEVLQGKCNRTMRTLPKERFMKGLEVLREKWKLRQD